MRARNVHCKPAKRRSHEAAGDDGALVEAIDAGSDRVSVIESNWGTRNDRALVTPAVTFPTQIVRRASPLSRLP
jgi:hypothetical protein